MSFSELIFAPFLITTFILFFLARKHLNLQIFILLIASLIFYGWWSVKFIGLIVFSTLLDFNMGDLIYQARSIKKKRLYLTISLVGNLGLLGYFKYANFFVENVRGFLQTLGMNAQWSGIEIILPVGISFYTFQTLSYCLDIYMGNLKPTKSLTKFFFFVIAFPQLVAGPIVRAKDFLPQLSTNLFKKSDEEGLFYILYGLIKKILIADVLGFYFVDKIFAAPHEYSSLELLLGAYFYAFQIFFDFSAYSDIAIGLGKIFGLEFPINFRAPYLAKNPRDFWQRWHITLSTWLRDYLYIPLGGNRVGRVRNIFNIMIVMLLGGLWHGANWTFIFWGLLHGTYVVVHRFFPEAKEPQGGRANPWIDGLKIFIFFHLVCLAWIFFRSENMHVAADYLKGLAAFNLNFGHFTVKFALAMLGISLFFHYVLEPKLKPLAQWFTAFHWPVRALIFYAFFVVLGYMGEQEITQKAFIYFQF